MICGLIALVALIGYLIVMIWKDEMVEGLAVILSLFLLLLASEIWSARKENQ